MYWNMYMPKVAVAGQDVGRAPLPQDVDAPEVVAAFVDERSYFFDSVSSVLDDAETAGVVREVRQVFVWVDGHLVHAQITKPTAYAGSCASGIA